MVLTAQIIWLDKPVAPFAQQISQEQCAPWKALLRNIVVGLVLYRVYCTNTYAASLAPNDERLGYAVITPFLTCQQSCGVGGKMSDSNFDLSKSSDSGSLA